MADRPLIPATEALLDGWIGPALHRWSPGDGDDGLEQAIARNGRALIRRGGTWDGGLARHPVLFLDPARREAAHRVVDVAREVYGVDLSALLDQPAALAEAWRGLVGGERG